MDNVAGHTVKGPHWDAGSPKSGSGAGSILSHCVIPENPFLLSAGALCGVQPRGHAARDG